jgi:farnesyl-diphosphate farnesyltransferase
MNDAPSIESVESWSHKDRHDENFPVGSLLISARLRPHMHAFYAFARNADDIADSPVLAANDKVARLDVMEAVLLGRRAAGSPSATRLRASLAETGVTPQHALELLIAFRRDATKPRTETWTELVDYCRYSAMPVGRYVLDLHGEAHDTWAPSDALCTALQILNHLQDVHGDLARLDRCYLPLALLRRHGAEVDDLRGSAATPALRRVFDDLLEDCDNLNQAALDLPRRTRNRRLRLETAVIVGLARRLAARLWRDDPLAARVKLSRGDALASVIAALRFVA